MKHIDEFSEGILHNLNGILEGEIKLFKSIRSDKVWIYVGQTTRFMEQRDPTADSEDFQTFLQRCHELSTYLVSQEDNGQASVLKAAKHLLAPDIPPPWHGYLYSTFQDSVILLVILDRPAQLGDPVESDVLTVISEQELPGLKDPGNSLIPGEGTGRITDAFTELGSPIALPDGNHDPDESPMALPAGPQESFTRVITATQAPILEEYQRLGQEYWICHYFAYPPDMDAVEGQPIHEQIKVVRTSGGVLPLNYLRCLVWFGLGADKPRQVLSLPCGDFLVMRSDANADLISIIQLDWAKLTRLVAPQKSSRNVSLNSGWEPN